MAVSLRKSDISIASEIINGLKNDIENSLERNIQRAHNAYINTYANAGDANDLWSIYIAALAALHEYKRVLYQVGAWESL